MQMTQPTNKMKLQTTSFWKLNFSLKKQGVINELITMVATDSDESSITEPYPRDIEFTITDTMARMRPRIHSGVKKTDYGRHPWLTWLESFN